MHGNGFDGYCIVMIALMDKLRDTYTRINKRAGDFYFRGHELLEIMMKPNGVESSSKYIQGTNHHEKNEMMFIVLIVVG